MLQVVDVGACANKPHKVPPGITNGNRAIQMLKDVVRKWWNVELAFADARGYVLDHAEGRVIPPDNDFCRLALFSKEGFRRCNESIKVTRDKLRATGPSMSDDEAETIAREAVAFARGHV